MESYAEFLAHCPEYQGTRQLDSLRAAEYARLDEGGHAYLDYTGGGLHAASQIRDHAELLSGRIFGNPHSASPTSSAMTSHVEEARSAVLGWFNAGDEYTAVFTQNATAALKHVGEAYPFSAEAEFLLTVDNHNSVNGIRQFASARGARVTYVPVTPPDLQIDRPCLHHHLAQPAAGPRLFAFPAQSNFSGVQHDLAIIQEAHDCGWDVLLDAAAFVPTNRLDLAAVKPDFVAISFYKMFGYPTGVGCLLARRGSLARLRRPWFAGGTVNFASVQGKHHVLASGEAGFEDGTLNYLAIPAVTIGLRHLQSIGIDPIHTRVACLTGWLLRQLLELRHTNGRPMVRIYGPASTAARGGTVTMNFYDPEGRLLDYRRVEELAAQELISLRTGCFCNPGAGEAAEGLTEDDVMAAVAESPDMTLPRFLQTITHRGGKSAGAVRVSLGVASNFADVERFVRFAERLRDQTTHALGEVSFDIESCRVIRDGS